MTSSIEDAYSSQLRNPTANHIEVRDGNTDVNAFNPLLIAPTIPPLLFLGAT